MDYFEHYEELPEQVKNLIGKHQDCEGDYNLCKAFVDDLNAIGWTAEYDLSGSLFDLRPLNNSDNTLRIAEFKALRESLKALPDAISASPESKKATEYARAYIAGWADGIAKHGGKAIDPVYFFLTLRGGSYKQLMNELDRSISNIENPTT